MLGLQQAASAFVSLIGKLLQSEGLELRVRVVGEHDPHDVQGRQPDRHGLRGTPDSEGQRPPVHPGVVPQLLREVRVP